MKPPGQLGDEGRNIPIAETSRRNMGDTLSYALARIRRDEGVDPDRYPPVKSDIEYDTRRTMIAAEVTARETADLILPAIRSTPALATTPRGGWVIKALVTCSFILLIATTTLGCLIYNEIQIAKNRRETIRSLNEHLGKALAENPKFTIKRDGADFVITYARSLEESMSDTIRIPHKIPPDELQRLNSH